MYAIFGLSFAKQLHCVVLQCNFEHDYLISIMPWLLIILEFSWAHNLGLHEGSFELQLTIFQWMRNIHGIEHGKCG